MLVLAATEMMFGSVDGLPIVLVVPASPEETVTVVPAATAMSLNSEMALRAAASGIGLPPKDSLRTSTWSVLTA